MNIIRLIRRALDAIIEAMIRGAVTKAGGDRDEFDIIDHKTGKPKQ